MKLKIITKESRPTVKVKFHIRRVMFINVLRFKTGIVHYCGKTTQSFLISSLVLGVYGWIGRLMVR
jgi:hypothetical protein